MSEPTVGSRIRILVAEDEENLAQILCTFLRGPRPLRRVRGRRKVGVAGRA
jgi:hypothetical protein